MFMKFQNGSSAIMGKEFREESMRGAIWTRLLGDAEVNKNPERFHGWCIPPAPGLNAPFS